jgi:hypothetical protein
MNDPSTPLSSAGLHRRDQILAVALRAAHRRRQRRLALRCTLSVAAAVAMAVTLLRFLPAPPVPMQARFMQIHPLSPVVTPAPASRPPVLTLRSTPHPVVIERVLTDSRITAELAVHPATGSVQRLGDDQLLEELSLAHRPAGLAHLRGKTLVLFRRASHEEQTRGDER